MLLSGRLAVPDDTVALLFDMDGVVLDTLALEIDLAPRLLRDVVSRDFTLSEDVIRANFPYAVPEFWRRIGFAVDHELTEEEVSQLTRKLDECRQSMAAPVHEGVVEILAAASGGGLLTGLVSNNPGAQILSMLDMAGLKGRFDVVVGNDIEGLRKKPAPDPYLEAARQLAVRPEQCVAIEDSLIGTEAAAAAGCFTVGVATGACDFQVLAASEHVDVAYVDFSKGAAARVEGDVA